MPRFAIAILVTLAVLLSHGSAEAAKRVALVIGNSAYEHATPLKNPKNDAMAVSSVLKKLGFEVISGTDLKRTALERKAREFAIAARGAKVALFFYAGHGLQVKGRNYLAPIDAKLGDEADLAFETVRLEDILGQMEREMRTNLVFLDACRDNPLARNLARSMGTRSASVGRGLARIESGIGTMIAFATQPGNVALDGKGNNSPFTQALLKHIETPNLDVALLMRRVREEVMAETNDRQVPWNNSSLTGTFSFREDAGGAPAPNASPDSSQLAALKKELETLRAKVNEKSDEPKVAIGIFPDKKASAPTRTLKPGDEFQECDGCPKMVVVPAGSFMMGSPENEKRREKDEGPRHKVTIPRPFAVGKFEVTVAQFEIFFKERDLKIEYPCLYWDFNVSFIPQRSTARTWRNPGYEQSHDHPATCVSHNLARDYATWLSKKFGGTYRLLSEAEWEYAARAGTRTVFHFGNRDSNICLYANGADREATIDGRNQLCSDGVGDKTASVGTYKANAFGLHDMHGNVFEWVQDCWNKNYVGAPSDGTPRETGDCESRVRRGGSWNEYPGYLRSATRFGGRGPSIYLGFRVARDLTDAELGK